jgi:hypothetical protein
MFSSSCTNDFLRVIFRVIFNDTHRRKQMPPGAAFREFSSQERDINSLADRNLGNLVSPAQSPSQSRNGEDGSPSMETFVWSRVFYLPGRVSALQYQAAVEVDYGIVFTSRKSQAKLEVSGFCHKHWPLEGSTRKE